MARGRPRAPLSIEWAVLVLALAALASLALPTAVRAVGGLALAILLAVMTLEALRSVRCPECLERRLVPVGGRAFGRRWAICRSCGRRWSRSLLGTWGPADGPEHDADFDQKRPTDPWAGGPVVDESAPADGTHSRLLRVKRAGRNPPRPRPPAA
jgi:hypothetical protein